MLRGFKKFWYQGKECGKKFKDWFGFKTLRLGGVPVLEGIHSCLGDGSVPNYMPLPYKNRITNKSKMHNESYSLIT